MFKLKPQNTVLYKFAFRHIRGQKGQLANAFRQIPDLMGYLACTLRGNNHLKGMYSVVFALVVCAVSIFGQPAITHAATPTLNFQARLESSTGAIAPDGNYNVQFKLYEGGTTSGGGTNVWTETRLNSATHGVRVANGYLTVNLGDITSFPGTINWDADLFLSMNIGGTTTGVPGWDGEMTPYLKLTSVPYAFQAQRAEQLSQLQGANTGTLNFDTLTADQDILLPNESGTLCIQNSSNCGFLDQTTADGSYIQNQSASLQAGNFALKSSATNIVTAKIQALTGQTSNLLQLNDSTGTVRLQVRSNGILDVGNSAYFYGLIGLDNTSWLQNSAATGTSLRFNTSGDATYHGAALLSVNEAASNGLIIQGAASQSADLLQIRDSSNSVLAKVGATGQFDSAVGYAYSGTAGSSADCSGSGEVLKDIVVQGGIVTGGTCGSAGSSGTFVTLQATTPATADVGNFNIDGTGIAATFEGTTSVLTPLLDTATAVALGIGTTNATGINLNANTAIQTGDILYFDGQGGNSQIKASATDVLEIGNYNASTGTIQFKSQTTQFQNTTDYKTNFQLNGNGDALFQNSTNTQNALQVQDSTNAVIFDVDTLYKRIGIGTNTATQALHIAQGNAVAPVTIKVQNTAGTSGTESRVMLSTTGTLANETTGAAITAHRTGGAGNGSTDLYLQTSNSSSVLTTQLTISSNGLSTFNGNVQVGGVTGASGKVTILGDTATERTLVVQAAPGQTQDVLSIRDGTGGFVAGYNANGDLYLNGILQSGTNTTAGEIWLKDGTANGYRGKIKIQALSQSTTYLLPDSTSSSDTFCLQTLGNCSGGGVTSFNSLVGGITIQGTTNQLQVTDDGSSTITLSLPQDINTTSSVTFGSLTIGSAGNTISLSNTGFVLSGTARPTKRIRLAAEYANALLDDAGLPNVMGTMTTGYDMTNRMSYYKWTTDQATNQSYELVVQVPIPEDFDGFTGAGANQMHITTWTGDTTNGMANIEIRDSSNSAAVNFDTVGSGNATPSATGTWQTTNFDISSGSYTAGDYLTLRIRLTSPQNGEVRVGNIYFDYKAKF